MTEFPQNLPHRPLTEAFPDIFFTTGQITLGPREASRNMVVLRHGDDLTVINSLRMNDAGLAQLDALGTVKNVIRLGGFHGRDDAFYLNRYGAAFHAAPGVELSRGEVITHPLTSGPGPLPGMEAYVLPTKTPEAALFLDRDDGIVITADALHNWTGRDEFFNDIGAEMMEKAGFFFPANIGPGWLNAVEPSSEDFDWFRQTRFENLLPGHGDPYLGGAREAALITFKRVFESG